MSKRVEVTVNSETGTMTFEPQTEGANSVTIDLNELYPGALDALRSTENGETAVRAFIHGNRQKLGDVYADKAKVPDDKVAEKVAEVADAIKGGQWNVKGSGGGGSRTNTILAEAISRLQGISLDEATDKLESFSPEERREIPKKYKAVKAEMDKIKAERAAENAKKAEASLGDEEEDLSGLFAE